VAKSKQSCLGVLVVFQHGVQCLHLHSFKHVILATQTNVEEPQQIVDFLRWLSDTETYSILT